MRRNFKFALYYVDFDRATCWRSERKETETYVCLQAYSYELLDDFNF